MITSLIKQFILLVISIFVFIPPTWLFLYIFFKKHPDFLTFSDKLLFVTSFSLVVIPLFCYIIYSAFSISILFDLYWVLLAISIIAIVFTYKRKLIFSPLSAISNQKVLLPFICLYLLIGLSLCEFQVGKNLYPSVTIFDYSKHVAISSAICSSDNRILNPFYFNPTEPLQYHTYWFFLPCLLKRTFPVQGFSMYDAVSACTLYTSLSFFMVIQLYIKKRFSGEQLRKTANWTLLLLLSITGLDILANFLLSISHSSATTIFILPTIEWWNPYQVTGWIDALIWIPHHISALVCSIYAMLLLDYGDGLSMNKSLLLGICLASMLGQSIFFSIGFFLSFGVVLIVNNCNFKGLLRIVRIACAFVLFSSPFLIQLFSFRTNGQGVLPFLFIRPSVGIINQFGYQIDLPLLLQNILLLPIQFVVELGFWLIVLFLYIKEIVQNKSTDRFQRNEFLFLVIAFILATFVTTPSKNIDINVRLLLIPQFILLVYGFNLINSNRIKNELRNPFSKGLLVLIICIGMIGTFSDLLIMRFYSFLQNAGNFNRLPYLSPIINTSDNSAWYEIREMYQTINQKTEKNLILQENPDSQINSWSLTYSENPFFISDKLYSSFFVEPDEEYSIKMKEVMNAFNSSDLFDIEKLCMRYPIDYLIVKENDLPFETLKIQKKHLAYDGQYVLAYHCGSR